MNSGDPHVQGWNCNSLTEDFKMQKQFIHELKKITMKIVSYRSILGLVKNTKGDLKNCGMKPSISIPSVAIRGD